MSADYRADLPALARGRAEALALTGDANLGYLAHYWAGYASWRSAMNGVSRGMTRAEVKTNLVEARAELEASVSLRDDSADACAAAASVSSWLATFHGDDALAMLELHKRAAALLARARKLEPDNPRVVWVEAGDLLFRPMSMGGNPDRAIELYRRQLAIAHDPDASSPLPDWGKPEAVMSLAYAHVTHQPPDLQAAAGEAEQALRIRPDWFYVRAVLVPQIEAAVRKKPE